MAIYECMHQVKHSSNASCDNLHGFCVEMHLNVHGK